MAGVTLFIRCRTKPEIARVKRADDDADRQPRDEDGDSRNGDDGHRNGGGGLLLRRLFGGHRHAAADKRSPLISHRDEPGCRIGRRSVRNSDIVFNGRRKCPPGSLVNRSAIAGAARHRAISMGSRTSCEAFPIQCEARQPREVQPRREHGGR